MQDQNTNPVAPDSSDPQSPVTPSPTSEVATTPTPEPTTSETETVAPSEVTSEPVAAESSVVAPAESIEPAPVVSNPTANPEPSPIAPDAPQGVVPASPAAKPGGLRKKMGLIVVVLLVLVVGAAAAVYTVHNHKQPVSTAKKDIPLLSYGIQGPILTKAYPDSVNTAAATQINSQLFEGLVRYQDQSNIVPSLATGWTNPDNTHWVFTLRQGVHFHSGRTVTAQDVKDSLDYAVAHQKDGDGSLVVSLASTIASVTATGSTKITITTNGPDPTLLNRLAALYVFDSKATAGSADAGTGPYVLKPGTSVGGTSIDLIASNSYWGGHVYTRALHIAGVSSGDTLASQTAASKFDVAGFLSTTQLATAQSKRSISVQDLGMNFIGINTIKTTSPLHTLAARQAAAYALDIPAILKAGGIQGEAASQLVPPAIPGYDASIHATPYDLAKAKQLLATVPNGTAPLTLTYVPADEKPVTEIAKQLTAAGFTIKTVPETDLGALVSIALSGKTDLFYLSYNSDTLDGLDILSSLLVGNGDYNNATVNTLAKQASSTLDPTTRIGLLQKISQQVAAEVPDIPLYTQTRVFTVQKPYHITTDMPNAYIGANFWKVYQD